MVGPVTKLKAFPKLASSIDRSNIAGSYGTRTRQRKWKSRRRRSEEREVKKMK